MMIFLKVYYISAGQTSVLASVSRDENCILIIRQFTALASSASVVQISGGSTPLAKEGARIFFCLFCFVFLFFCFFVFLFFFVLFFFLLALPTFLRSAILFLPKGPFCPLPWIRHLKWINTNKFHQGLMCIQSKYLITLSDIA